jgi:hypothetical protein
MGIREGAELFGIHAPDIPEDRWFEYLRVLAESAHDSHELVEPDWD